MLKRFALILVFQGCWAQTCFLNVMVTQSVSQILGKWALTVVSTQIGLQMVCNQQEP